MCAISHVTISSINPSLSTCIFWYLSLLIYSIYMFPYSCLSIYFVNPYLSKTIYATLYLSLPTASPVNDYPYLYPSYPTQLISNKMLYLISSYLISSHLIYSIKLSNFGAQSHFCNLFWIMLSLQSNSLQ